MTRIVSYDDLADVIAEELGVYLFPPPQFTVENSWYTGSWVWVTSSFPGYHSSPYVGRVRLDPYASETISLAQSFVEFLGQQSYVAVSDLSDADPLLRLMAEIVGNDDASDRFFDILADQEEKFELEATLAALQAEALLPSAVAWESERVRESGLDELLAALAERGRLRLEAKIKLHEYRWRYVRHDHRHYLLFGQNEDRIAPKSWFNAAWDFIQHFRCNFGIFVTEAMLYENVTIVGADNATAAVSRDDQWFLEEYTGYLERTDGNKERWRKVERLNVVNAQQLTDLLAERVSRNVRFEGGEIPPLG